jgi:hypothetical protein
MSQKIATNPKPIQVTTKAASNVPTLGPDSLITDRNVRKLGVIPFGSDNLFPQAIAALNRKSGVHRGILNKKTNYITGGGFSTANEDLLAFTKDVNTNKESLTEIIAKLTYDHLSDGNAYFEIITDEKQQYLNIEHHDHTTVRIHESRQGFVSSMNWRDKKHTTTYYPKFPNVKEFEDGTLRAMLPIRSYEPEFINYGVMDWIAGLDAAAIGYKTNRWNIARLDNSFQTSGVLMISGEFEDDEEALRLKSDITKEFSGEDTQGKVMVIVSSLDGTNSKFIPFDQKFEGDWNKLSEESIRDLIATHSWYRSLMSLGDNNGFDTNRILNEYDMALIDTIKPKQNLLLRPIKTVIETVLGFDTNDLEFINNAPIQREVDKFLKVWEARKMRGLDFDQKDPEQQKFLFQVL